MLLGRDHLLWLLGSLCEVQRVPFDRNLILQNYPPPLTDLTLIAAGKALGFRIGAVNLNSLNSRHLTFPCIVFFKADPARVRIKPEELDDKSGAKDAIETGAFPVLMIRGDGDRVLYFESGTQTPKFVRHGEINGLFSSTCFLKIRITGVELECAIV